MKLDDIPGYRASRLTFNLMAQQSETGFQFDIEGARTLAEKIKVMMREIEEEVEPQLPSRPLKKSEENEYRFPAKPFKKDGTLSVSGQNFLDKHNLELIGINHVEWKGVTTKIVGGELLPADAKMTLANQEDLKNWFLEQGWKPTLWNVKRDERGKPVRDEKGRVIETTPKMQEMGRLCHNLEELQGDIAKKVVKWLSMRNRLSVIEGWLANDRLQKDGKLSASFSGITPTNRMRHSVVVNLPKADPNVLLGKEMRSLFIARPDRVLVGYDAAALEARVEGHYTILYDGGEEYARTLIEEDVHLNTALAVFTDHVGHLFNTPRWNKDDHELKPWRSKAKNIRYASGYGATAPKIASMLGVSLSEAEDILERFWRSASPLAKFRDKLTLYWERVGEKKWIKGIDGRKIQTRSKHSLVNAAFQSCGAICMDYANLFMDKWLGGIKVDSCGTPGYLYNGHWVYRVGFMHDELVYDCPEEVSEDIGELGVKSIRKAGEFLKLRIPLDGDYKVGNSWAEIH